ncbi:unnamed protein product [Staurois parvus]|uniref:Uncharacterized protein n=1 Tax=Staurois parvus TaxID=386267 RepID=A0ABN9CDV8_9NEOB|nr:unnamed protein product [Staurois parvus]
MYTDHQGNDDQCVLMISVAPEVPPVSVPSVPAVSAHQCHVPVPTCQCISVHTSVHQWHISVPI